MSTALPPQAIDAAKNYLFRYPTESRILGERLFIDRAVEFIEPTDDCEYDGIVNDSGSREVKLVFKKSQWRDQCNCLRGRGCQHTYAALRALLQQESTGKRSDGSSTDQPKAEPSPKPITFKTTIEQKLGRKLDAKELKIVAAIENLYAKHRSSSVVPEGALAEFHERKPFYSNWYTYKLWHTPPRDPWETWLYIANHLRKEEKAWPPFLREITSIEEVDTLVAEWERKQRIELWKTRLKELEAEVDTEQTDEVELRIVCEPKAVHLEMRKGASPGWVLVKRDQFRELQAQAYDGTLSFADEESSAVWAIFTQKFVEFGAINYDNEEALGPIFRHPLITSRVLTNAREPFRRASERLQWRMDAPESAQGDYRLTLALPDGTPPPQALCTIEGKPTNSIKLRKVDRQRGGGGGRVGMTKSAFGVKVEEAIQVLLGDPEFLSRHRSHEKAFTRERSLTFVRVMLLVLQKTLKSVQLHLHEFFAALSAGTLMQAVTGSAWTQARAKLKHTAFVELSQKAVLEPIYSNSEALKLWHGHRLLANDGSVLRLPQDPRLFKFFGGQEEKLHPNGAFIGYIPHARLSVLYDCLNRLVLDARVGKYTDHERALALEHLSAARQGDLILFDRGYAGYLLLAEMMARGLHFVVRCNQHCFTEATKLFERNEHGVSVTVMLPAKSRRREAKAAGLALELKVRFISLRLPGGELEVLVTSLLDEVLYPTEEFMGVYHLRWGVETFYGQLKGRLDLENFSGLTVESVLQDIHAAVFLTNLESVVTQEAAARLPQPNYPQGRRRYKKKINRAVSFHALKSRVIDLLIGKDPPEKVLAELTELFLANPVSERPERVRPRRNVSRARIIDFLKRSRKIVF